METILKKDKKQEAQELIDLVDILDEKEKQELKIFLQGISFAKKYRGEGIRTA